MASYKPDEPHKPLSPHNTPTSSGVNCAQPSLSPSGAVCPLPSTSLPGSTSLCSLPSISTIQLHDQEEQLYANSFQTIRCMYIATATCNNIRPCANQNCIIRECSTYRKPCPEGMAFYTFTEYLPGFKPQSNRSD